MRKEKYINEVTSKISNKKARREVEKELSAHIDDRISYYVDAGWDEETATEKAMEHMGEPQKVSEEMGNLHSKELSDFIFYLTCVGAGKLVLALISFVLGYFSVPILSIISVAFCLLEMYLEVWNMFNLLLCIVLGLLIIICVKRMIDKTFNVKDLLMTFGCIIIWLIGAYASYNVVLQLGF